MSWVTPEQFATQVILNVCELPDYTSPDDQPDLLQCTVRELEACVVREPSSTSTPTAQAQRIIHVMSRSQNERAG